MAAEVEVQTGEVGRTVVGGRLHLSPLTDASNKGLNEISSINQSHIISQEPNKPALVPKPRLTPKPFAMERNPTIKPILAPKPQTKPRPESTRLAGYKPEPPRSPKPQQLVATGKPRPLSTNPSRPSPTSFKTTNGLNTGQTTKPVAQPFKPAPPLDLGDPSKPRQKPRTSNLAYSKSLKQFPASEWSGATKNQDEETKSSKSEGSITRAKSMGFLAQVGKEEEEKEKENPEAAVLLRPKPRASRPRPVSAIFLDSPTETPAPSLRWARRPLSADLTARFESIGLSLHRKTPKANTNENSPEETEPAQKREQVKTPKSITQQSTDGSSKENAEEDKRKVSIKSRISLLLDSSSSPVTGVPAQGSDPHSPVQPVPDIEPPAGVQQIIRQLTEDSSPVQSPTAKPAPRPRPLPFDLTKRFSSERSPELGNVFFSDATDRDEISKDPQRRIEEAAISPSDQRTVVHLNDAQEPLKKVSTPEGPKAGAGSGATSKQSVPSNDVHTVKASLFENVVERHCVLLVEDSSPVNKPGDLLRSPPFKSKGGEDDGTIVTATHQEPLSPSSPLRVTHAFDTVQAVEGSRAVSEHIPSAQWEDKAMTLRSRRSEGAAAAQPATALMPEQQPRVLRVGALQKWTSAGADTTVEKGGFKESQRGGQGASNEDRARQLEAEQEEVAAAPKRLKILQSDEQPKPRATYFALTGQMQEPASPVDGGAGLLDFDEFSVRSALGGSQGKHLTTRRNPSLDKAFEKNDQVEDLMMGHISQRGIRATVAAEESMQDEKRRELQKETERHMAKMKELLLREQQRLLEVEEEAHLEFAQMKEREMQREFERQRQKAFEKEKQEFEEQQRALERQKQFELEQRQKLQELERARLREIEKERQLQHEKERRQKMERQKIMEREKLQEQERERQRMMEREKLQEQERERQRMMEREKLQEQERERQRMMEREKLQEQERERQRMMEREKLQEQERERQREQERQRQREEERQRELDKERQLLEVQRENQRVQELRRIKEPERQQLLQFEKQMQKEKETQQQLMELEAQRLREKTEKEAEKMKQMAIEQEVLRMKELVKEKERQKEMEKEHRRAVEREKQRELERQRQRDLERERQRQLDNERQELEKQRLRQQELEKERQRKEELEQIKEMERRRLLELEKQKQAERDRRQVLEAEKRRLRESAERGEAEKMRHVAKQQEVERQRLKERQKREEQERARMEQDTVRRNESFSKAPSLRSDPANRWKEPSPRGEASYRPAILDIDSFTSQVQPSPGKELFPVPGIQGSDAAFGARVHPPTPDVDVSWRLPQQTPGITSPAWTTSPQDPWELRPVEMPADKPVPVTRQSSGKLTPEQLLLRQGERLLAPQRLPSSAPQEQVWHPREEQQQQQQQPPQQPPPLDSRGEVLSQRRSQGSQELNRMRSRSVSRRSAPSSSALERSLSRMRSRSAHREQDGNSWVQQKQSDSGEEEGKDSGTPVRDTDSQYGTWETGLRTDDSLTPATPSSESNPSPSSRKPTPTRKSGDLLSPFETDAVDGLLPFPSSGSEPLAFPDTPTTLLDTSALRSRAQLGKKRAPRTRPSRAARQSEEGGGATEDWLYTDSTEAKAATKDDDSDSGEPTKGADASAAASFQPQRFALFPGMDPSALKAQLRKRGDSDNQIDGAAPSSSQLSRSPKSPFLPRAARVLPPSGGKENGEEDSPQWLKELKSKKRLSQYDNDS